MPISFSFPLPARALAAALLLALPSHAAFAADAATPGPDPATAPAAALAAARAEGRALVARQRQASARRLTFPEPASLYSPAPALSGPRPRYLFPGRPLAEMRARWADPRYAPNVSRLRADAAPWTTEPVPARPDMRVEDPLRAHADLLAPFALAILLEPDPSTRARWLAGLERWLDAQLSWGLPHEDLPLSQQIHGFAAVYDWLHSELDPARLAALRLALIERARWMRDPANTTARRWRDTEFTANHNWFNYGALGLAAAVLWADEAAPLAPGELRTWLDEAVVNFHLVEQLQPRDGGAMEGYLYQDYGFRPYFDFAVLADQTLALRHSFLDTPSVRALSSRLHSLLPGEAGFHVYGDSEIPMFSSESVFRLLASRFGDARAQTLADIMRRRFRVIKHVSTDPGVWRTLFWADLDLPAAPLDAQPLAHDWPDLGLFSARSGWGDTAGFFGLRCGPATGHTASRLMGPGYSNGHGAPDQGNFTFYAGPAAILPGANYARTKLTTHHNLVVFEGRDRQAGPAPVGQLGGGLPWFGQYGSRHDRVRRPAAVVRRLSRPGLEAYVCDLGGVYELADERVPGGAFYPEYHRILVYLPGRSAVLVADRVATPVPRTAHFRLLTAATDLALADRAFEFTVKGARGRILDLSPGDHARAVRKEENHVWRDPKRDVAILTATDATETVFVALLAMTDGEHGLSVAADATGLLLTGATPEPLLIPWPLPLPAPVR